MSIYEYDEEKHLRMEREQSYADGLKQGIEQGIEQGCKKTSERMNQLILKLSALGRMDEIVQAAENPEYQKKLFEEFKL